MRSETNGMRREMMSSGRSGVDVIPKCCYAIIMQNCRYIMFTEGLRNQVEISQSLSPWKQ